MGKGILFAAFSAAFFSSGVVFVRFAYQAGLQPGAALVLRFVFAAALLVMYLWFSGSWVRLPSKESLGLFILGLAAYTTLGVTWFVALSMIPAWLVSLFSPFQPVLVILGSWVFLKGDFRPRLLAPLSVVVLGGVLLFWQPFSAVQVLGLVLMLVNLVVYAAYVLVGQGMINRRSPETAVWWVFCGAAAGSVIYALGMGQLSFHFAPLGWLWAGCLALFSTVLAITFFWAGVRRLGPARSAIISALDPFFSVCLAVGVLGERLQPQQLIGGVLIIAGVVFVRMWS